MPTKTKIRKPVLEKKVSSSSEQSAEDEILRKKIKTFELKLTIDELIHLRDLMSILLPPDGTVTLSQSLAQTEQKNAMVEAKLWSKVVESCKEANVPTDDEAPDFAVGISGAPALAVYALQLDKYSGDEEE